MSMLPESSDDAGTTDRRLAGSIDDIPDAVVVAAAETGRVVAANAAAGELFDCRPGALVGLDHADLYPSGESVAHRAAFRRSIDEGRAVRHRDAGPLRVETTDGEHIPVEINAKRVGALPGTGGAGASDGDEPAGGEGTAASTDTGSETGATARDDGGTRDSLVLGVFREVSEHRRRERELERTSTRLETLLDATPLPTAVLDPSGTVVRWNRAAEATFGYDAGEVVSRPYPLFVDDGEFRRVFEQLLDDDILDGYETVHRAQDGSLLDVELYARPLYENGSLAGVIGTAIDISDRNRRAQRLDVLDRVLRHDLRNQLTVVRGFADALIGPSIDPETRREYARSIVAASDRLAELSEQAGEMRTAIRRSEGGPDPAAVDALVTAVADGARADHPAATVNVSPADGTALVPERAGELVADLLAYALSRVKDPTVEVDVRVCDRYVRLTVRGSAPLIPETERALIENGEETQLKHGIGLDVAQAYLGLTAIGSDVAIADDPPDGSTLHVDLPTAGAATPEDAASE